MQFDEFDKKIVDAANNHHPAYDEQAWAKMEKLLDKHLPQEKEDRRRFLFLFLLLLGLGGIVVLITRPFQSKTAIAKQNSTISHSNLPVSKSADSSTNTSQTTTGNITMPSINSSSKIGDDVLVSSDKILLGAAHPLRIFNSNKKTKGLSLPGVTDKLADGKNETVGQPDISATTESSFNTLPDPDNKTIQSNKAGDKQIDVPGQQVMPKTKQTTEIIAPAQVSASKKSDEKKKEGSKEKNAFFLTLSTSPDVSFVGSNNLGTTKFMVGAGIGYTIHDKFSIRTGLFTGRKVYTAEPSYYHPPAAFYIYYPYLESVAANCKVYEIPLYLSYTIKNKSSYKLFATAGISSYIMKKETYNYSYKYTATGPTYNHAYTINDKNKHYFSAITLSAGYQKKISNRISLSAEPYIKLPLSGIGYGKVKLNSGGILFSVAIKPFR